MTEIKVKGQNDATPSSVPPGCNCWCWPELYVVGAVQGDVAGGCGCYCVNNPIMGECELTSAYLF